MRRFRVWSDFWKRYAFDAELYADGSLYAMFEDDDGVSHHENTDLVLEFDTDLKDKSGNDIYDGDIVKAGGRIYEVDWLEKDGGWFCFTDDDYYTPLYHIECEVIGNIHKNPELLEEEK